MGARADHARRARAPSRPRGAAASFWRSSASSSGESIHVGRGRRLLGRVAELVGGLVLAVALVAGLLAAALGRAPQAAAPHVLLARELVAPLGGRVGDELGQPRRRGGQRGPVGGGDLEHAEEHARGPVRGVVRRRGADHAPALGAHPEDELGARAGRRRAACR